MSLPLLRLGGAVLLALLALALFYAVRSLQLRRRRRRQLHDDALKLIFKRRAHGIQPSLPFIAEALRLTAPQTAALLASLRAAGLVVGDDDDLRLTAEGAAAASHVVRAHRLWERYLADYTGYEARAWHQHAEEREHALDSAALADLDARLGFPTHDPHGDPIPPADGSFVAHGGQPLSAAEPGALLRIVHLEDEPPQVFAQLHAAGLAAGQEITLLARDEAGYRLRRAGAVLTLPPEAAANVSVVPLTQPAADALPEARLAQLALGESARVAGIARTCRQTERRRLLDLGLVPGTVVTALLRSPSGDPVAYDVRGGLIALRREQAAHIAVEEVSP